MSTFMLNFETLKSQEIFPIRDPNKCLDSPRSLAIWGLRIVIVTCQWVLDGASDILLLLLWKKITIMSDVLLCYVITMSRQATRGACARTPCVTGTVKYPIRKTPLWYSNHHIKRHHGQYLVYWETMYVKVNHAVPW